MGINYSAFLCLCSRIFLTLKKWQSFQSWTLEQKQCSYTRMFAVCISVAAKPVLCFSGNFTISLIYEIIRQWNLSVCTRDSIPFTTCDKNILYCVLHGDNDLPWRCLFISTKTVLFKKFPKSHYRFLLRHFDPVSCFFCIMQSVPYFGRVMPIKGPHWVACVILLNQIMFFLRYSVYPSVAGGPVLVYLLQSEQFICEILKLTLSAPIYHESIGILSKTPCDAASLLIPLGRWDFLLYLVPLTFCLSTMLFRRYSLNGPFSGCSVRRHPGVRSSGPVYFPQCLNEPFCSINLICLRQPVLLQVCAETNLLTGSG